MEFPHMKDDAFPHIDTVDVYKFQNDFDYNRWQGKVSFKLLDVRWNSDYSDVPAFENDKIRDKWFDDKKGVVRTLESAFNVTPKTSIRVPIPYNEAYKYNYIVVDMPVQTSVEQPIDYENPIDRVGRWYYFIDSMEQYAPNTTELYVSLDVWTTFMHSVDIPYLMLERGHAPMASVSVDEYLANPIENNEHLLADDFNYGKSTVISNSSYLPVGNGRKYVLFAVPMTQANLLLVGGSPLSGNWTDPTFASTEERWGNQIVVNDYEWKYGNVDYSNATLNISSFLNEDSVFNGNYVFAIASENASAFFDKLASECVHLLHAIQAVFVVAEDMIKLGTVFTFKTFSICQVDKQYLTYDLNLNKDAFGFDGKYKEIAKLYTYPYSVLEITDDNGFTSEVRIENTGNIQFHKEISIAFPFVRYQCFFTGFNGNGKLNYTWKNLNNQNVQKTMWEDDFSSYMMNWDIPTFAVYVSAEAEYATHNFASMQARRSGAIVDYENAVRYANTTYENVDDETDTMQANTATQNAANTTITATSNNASYANTARGNLASQNNAGHNKSKIQVDMVQDAQLSAALTGLQNDVIASSTALNNACSIDVAGYGAIGSAITNPTTAGGGIGNIVGAVISANTATATSGIVIGTNIASVIDTASVNANKMVNAQNNIQNVTDEQTTAQTDMTDNSCQANAANTATQNAANTTTTNATCTTMDNNADWTRDATVVASQNNLKQAQREAKAQYLNNRLGNPVLETTYSGDAYPDVFERRGVRMNLRTQSKSAISQVGDAFLRFGYALHKVWDMSNGFHYGKHFTYWKAEDVWINDGNGVAGNSVNVIHDILMNGVTVWRNPDEIGRVSIYDNI